MQQDRIKAQENETNVLILKQMKNNFI